MKKIYSQEKPDLLLHVVCRAEDFKDGRLDVISEDEFIQCSLLKMNKGKTFKPHKHIWKKAPMPRVIAQESWIVLTGSVMCVFYDIDDVVIDMVVLRAHDISFTLQGGHTYNILEDNTMVAEYKTGPYEGQELDKVFIKE